MVSESTSVRILFPPPQRPGNWINEAKHLSVGLIAKPRRISGDKANELRELYKSKGPDLPFEQVIIAVSY